MPGPFSLAPLLDEPWAVAPSMLSKLVDHVAHRGDPRELFAAFGRSAQAPAPRSGAVAVIPIHGFISQRASIFDAMFGGTSVETIRDSFRAAIADPNVSAVVFDVDSPGGTVSGVTELASEIRAARGQGKAIVAVANGLMASAAYWLASQADEVVASPSALVGNVGIFAVHQEISEHLAREGIKTTLISAGDQKTAGNEYEPLTDEARAALQERADTMYGTFVDDVAKGRRLPAATIRGDWGARAMMSKAATAAGMADFVGTFEDALRRASRRPAGARAEGEAPALAELPEPFSERLLLLAEDAAALAEHGAGRAVLRAREGRAPLSDTHLASVRATRDAMDALLALVDPAPATPAVDPPKTPAVDPPKPPVVDPPPAVQPVAASRFRSEADWTAYITSER